MVHAVYPPLWMWAVGVSLVLLGLWQTRRSRRRFGRGSSYPPAWFCALLAGAALVGMWFLLNAQFGGQVIQIHLP